jgi:prepilin peptidase CpaA
MPMSELTPGATWLVATILVVAAAIDCRWFRVPNWLTFPFVLGGLGYALAGDGPRGLLWSLAGAGAGLALLLPLWPIGGIGAGDVKLLAGVGAWVGPSLVLGVFTHAMAAGVAIALAVVAWKGTTYKFVANLLEILDDLRRLRRGTAGLPEVAANAAARRPNSTALPFGLPIAVGSIALFASMGLFAGH